MNVLLTVNTWVNGDFSNTLNVDSYTYTSLDQMFRRVVTTRTESTSMSRPTARSTFPPTRSMSLGPHTSATSGPMSCRALASPRLARARRTTSPMNPSSAPTPAASSLTAPSPTSACSPNRAAKAWPLMATATSTWPPATCSFITPPASSSRRVVTPRAATQHRLRAAPARAPCSSSPSRASTRCRRANSPLCSSLRAGPPARSLPRPRPPAGTAAYWYFFNSFRRFLPMTYLVFPSPERC